MIQANLIGPLDDGFHGFFPVTISTMSVVIAFHLRKILAKVVKILQKNVGGNFLSPKNNNINNLFVFLPFIMYFGIKINLHEASIS